jgi:hypothetical protein
VGGGRGGFDTVKRAVAAAKRLADIYGGGWKVIHCTRRAHAAWAMGDHSQPPEGVTVAEGDMKEKVA